MLKVYAYFADKRVGEDGKPVTNGYSIAQFRKEWGELSAESKAQLIAGVADASLNY